MSKTKEEPIDYSVLSPEEADAAHKALPPDRRAVCDKVQQARDRLRAAGKSTRRCDIRAEAAMNIDDVITFMALLEAMERPITSYSRPEPEVPSAVADVTAEAKANADIGRQRIDDAFRTSLQEHSAKVARLYEADLEDSRKTILGLREHIDDLNKTSVRVAHATRALREDVENQGLALVDVRAERDRANVQVAVLTASNADLVTSNNGLKDQVVALKTENADVRRMNEVLENQLSESKHDHDMLKAEAEKVPGLQLDAAVLKRERDDRADQAATYLMMWKEAQNQAFIMAQLRGDLAAARGRILELEKNLEGVRNFAAAD
jgi:hypothetical protein